MFLALFAVVALLAVAMAELLDQAAPFLGIIGPPAVAFVVKYDSSPLTKQIMTVLIVVVLAVVSLGMQDWGGGLTLNLLATRALVLLGESQLVYWTVNRMINQWAGHESINALEVFRPNSGI